MDKHYIFCLWNARSLVNKLSYFHTILFSRKVHCFCVTETWLGETIHDAELGTSNYQIFRCDRKNKGGGVLIAVNKSIRSIQLTIEYNIEAVMVELESHIIVLCIYAQPNCSSEYFHDLLACLHSLPEDKNILVTGDFNLPEIHWETLSGGGVRSTEFCDCIFGKNLVQLILEPTHRMGNTLDLVLSNQPDRICKLWLDSNTPSDHYLVTFELLRKKTVTCNSQGSKHVFCFSRADMLGLDHFLLLSDFGPMLQSDIENSYGHLIAILDDACSRFIPKTALRKSASPAWFTAEIRHVLNKIHTVRRHIKRKPTESQLAKLKTLEDKLQSMIEVSKEEYIAGLVDTFHSEPKKLYRYLKKISSKQAVNTFIGLDNKVLQDPQSISDAFNKFFNSTFTTSEYRLPASLPTPSSQLSFINITASETFEALSALDITKAMGCDKLSPRVLKACATSLCEPVAQLFNRSMTFSELPTVWKCHKITPVPKSGDLSKINNYRPISLLCILLKVMESILYSNIIDFVRPQLSNYQYGFLSNRSCVQQLLTCHHEIIKGYECGKASDMVFLDFKKAFDSVPHDELLYKLWRIGITGSLWRWFRAYLNNRWHYVDYEGYSSTKLAVRSGVPQGSVLGPLLFLIYINDISIPVINSDLYIFADDTKVRKIISQAIDTEQLQEDLHCIDRWCKKWKICINPMKTAHIRFSLRSAESDQVYYVGSCPITSVDTHKDLGITVSASLTWSKHIAKICRRAYTALYTLRRIIPQRSSVGLRRRLYLSNIRSLLIYGSQVWNPHLLQDIKSLEQVQRRATKFILQESKLGYKERLINLDFLPLTMWLELQDILFLIKHMKSPSDNFNIFEYVRFNESASRSSTKKHLVHNYTRTNKARHFYYNRVVRLWNKLPEINLESSVAYTKVYLTKILWNHFLHSFDPDNTCSYHFCCPCSSCI